MGEGDLKEFGLVGEEEEEAALRELLCKNFARNSSANFSNERKFLNCFPKFNLSVMDIYHEYEEVLEWSAFPENVIVPVLFGIIFIAGLVGNGLVLFVVARSGFGGMKKVTNLYFGNLALADTCFLVVCVPTTAITYILPSWPFGPHVCKYIYTCYINKILR